MPPSPQSDEKAPPVLLGSEQENKVAGACLQNRFYSSPAQCKTQVFVSCEKDITKEWLTGALNCEVKSFDTVVCGQGQMGVTFIVQNIKYGRQVGTTRPSSVAIKVHVSAEGVMPVVRLLNLYSRELYFYTAFQDQVPMKSPKVYAAWADANGADLGGEPVEAFNLMMEDLRDEWEGFDTVSNTPTLEEFKRIALGVVPLHVKFWKNPAIQTPPLSTCGTHFDYLEKFAPLRPLIGQTWPPVCEAMPGLAGWGSEWPAEFSELLDFVNGLVGNFEKFERLHNIIGDILNKRPMTLVHGDLNAGNIWKKKSNPKELLYCDWQMTRMGPPGFDFGIMLVVLPNGPSGEETTELMQTYHNALPEPLRKEYTLSQLRDDFKTQVIQLMFGIPFVMVGQLDPSCMDATKFEFTWKSYWPAVWRRFVQLYRDEGIKEFAQQLLDGRYNNFGK
jgi:hypothetical protein